MKTMDLKDEFGRISKVRYPENVYGDIGNYRWFASKLQQDTHPDLDIDLLDDKGNFVDKINWVHFLALTSHVNNLSDALFQKPSLCRHVTCNDGSTVLMFAAQQANIAALRVIKVAIDRNNEQVLLCVNVNDKTNDGVTTALDFALSTAIEVEMNNASSSNLKQYAAESIQELLSYGAKLSPQTNEWKHPLVQKVRASIAFRDGKYGEYCAIKLAPVLSFIQGHKVVSAVIALATVAVCLYAAKGSDFVSKIDVQKNVIDKMLGLFSKSAER